MSSSTNRHARTRRRGRRAAIATVIAALALVAGLAGCGGSSKSHTASPATQPAAASTSTPSTTSTGAPTTGARISGHSRSGGSQKPTNATGAKQRIRAIPILAPSQTQHGKAAGKRSGALRPQGPNPCVFISSADAQAIIGAAITSETEAPLGPTCVFHVKGQRQTVTIAVESGNPATQARYMRKRQQLSVSGHQAYCGVLGRAMLDVSLNGGKYLNVTATPCSIAEALATKALARIVAS
jgi:hypothetical protein